MVDGLQVLDAGSEKRVHDKRVVVVVVEVGSISIHTITLVPAVDEIDTLFHPFCCVVGRVLVKSGLNGGREQDPVVLVRARIMEGNTEIGFKICLCCV